MQFPSTLSFLLLQVVHLLTCWLKSHEYIHLRTKSSCIQPILTYTGRREDETPFCAKGLVPRGICWLDFHLDPAANICLYTKMGFQARDQAQIDLLRKSRAKSSPLHIPYDVCGSFGVRLSSFPREVELLKF